MIMRFVEETDGKSFVQVNDGSKKDEKEYASKGVAGTALGLGIAGTALWLLNGGLGGVEIGNGTIRVKIPLIDKVIELDTNDLTAFKETLTSK